MVKFFQTLAVVCAMAFTAFAQETTSAAKGVNYGEQITAKGAFPITKLTAKMGDAQTLNTKVYAKVLEVCTKKGCWMKVENANGETTMVTFKDYGFFMPQNLVGKTVVLEGVSQQKISTIEEQKHYAEDAGKSKEEIAKITTAKKKIAFEAKGVLVM